MANTPDESTHQRFSTRIGFLLSALGVAVGTGNIWRFPRIVAQNGGDEGAGAFMVAWVTCLLMWSIPLIIAEYFIGRKTRKGPIGAFTILSGGKLSWMGGFVAFVSTAIMFYYAVVVGWVLFYFTQSILQPLPQSTEEAFTTWNQFQSSSWPFICHAIVIALGALVVWKGISSIERVNKVLMPTLLIIVAGCVIRAVTLPGSSEGLAYIFTPEWDQLADPRVWLEALTQNAWDTGAGWGLFLVYAAYMQREHGLVKNAFVTGIGNNTVSLMASFMIFGTVFSILQHEMQMGDAQILEIMRSSGPGSTGLTFIWTPQLFARMTFGTPIAILFFLGLMFAGFTSFIAMLELSTRTLVDFGVNRSRALVWVIAVCYVLGIPSVYSLDFLGNQDFVWGVALMISGAFVAIGVLRYGLDKLKQEELETDGTDWALGKWWNADIRYVVPLLALALLVWWLWLSAAVYAPDRWYDPFNPYSIATVLTQWGAVIGLLLLGNSWLNRKSVGEVGR